jgi:CP4-57 regulatory protein AlpA
MPLQNFPNLLRFSDLKAHGVVANWVTLLRWIEHEGFPPGRKLGPNTRCWNQDEIEQWIASRPTAGTDSKQTEAA